MRLRHDAVLFEYAGIPMVGNPENGGTIGLTPGGKELCERMRVSDVPDEEAFRLEPELAQCLSEAGFIRDVEVDRGEGRLTSAYLHVTDETCPVGDAIRTARRGTPATTRPPRT